MLISGTVDWFELERTFKDHLVLTPLQTYQQETILKRKILPLNQSSH